MGANRIVVVGASLAGGRAAEQIRRGGYDGSIVLVGGVTHRPYDRPPLSKKFLRGQHAQEKLFLRALEHYDAQQIELALGVRATGLDATARKVSLDDGRTLDFDHLVIATGAEVRRLSCPGARLPGIHYLRTIDDALAIRKEMEHAKRMVVVGAGVIGAEVAASCREEGIEVVMLETARLPLLRAFGPEIGAIYQDVHRSRGVDLRCGVEVASFRGETHVEEVVTTAGDAIRCDFVVAGIGVTPATRWLEGSGIPLDPATGAVIVDERGRSEVPGIWAAGDVASAWDATLGRRVCVESIDNAMNQAAVVASNLTGRPSVHGGVPFFWSDQYDLKLQSVGHIGPYERAVVRGSIEERAFVVFHMVGAEVRFVIAVNRMKEIAGSKKLIAGRVACSDQALADASIPIASLLPPAP